MKVSSKNPAAVAAAATTPAKAALPSASSAGLAAVKDTMKTAASSVDKTSTKSFIGKIPALALVALGVSVGIIIVRYLVKVFSEAPQEGFTEIAVGNLTKQNEKDIHYILKTVGNWETYWALTKTGHVPYLLAAGDRLQKCSVADILLYVAKAKGNVAENLRKILESKESISIPSFKPREIGSSFIKEISKKLTEEKVKKNTFTPDYITNLAHALNIQEQEVQGLVTQNQWESLLYIIANGTSSS